MEADNLALAGIGTLDDPEDFRSIDVSLGSIALLARDPSRSTAFALLWLRFSLAVLLELDGTDTVIASSAAVTGASGTMGMRFGLSSSGASARCASAGSPGVMSISTFRIKLIK
ncbi:predicted protein [Plenodomus lingam JN3]|uniref:Predicted protein n=1 Tax=Leptosphaeria maculans (strain JN3 / isolate v23.1.3 / race Av1-4-5-6-7-8) TaxID=985895 RepID=E5A8H3_LEPMJ|nr:predicted protein [Plenodomus lingam JN3]CBX99918.1 predicted protein [Plenodomus lingam JN3]